MLCLQRRSLSIVKVFFTHAVSVYKKELRWFGAVELVRRGVLILTAQASNSSGVSECVCVDTVTQLHCMNGLLCTRVFTLYVSHVYVQYMIVFSTRSVLHIL